MDNVCFTTRDKCPVCTSASTLKIYSCGFHESPIRDYLEAFYLSRGKIELEYLQGGSYLLDECRECGTIFQRQIPDDFLLAKIYEEWIDPTIAFKTQQEKEDLNYIGRCLQEIILIIGYFGLPAHQLKVLDFGMGWGRWVRIARALGCDSMGIELSPTRIAHAESHGITTVPINDILNYKFDYINCEQVFEHIAEPLETLRYLRRALKPGGIIKINVPDGSRIKQYLAKYTWSADLESCKRLNAISPLEHINCYRRCSLVKMAELAGLDLVQLPFSLQLQYCVNTKGLKGIAKYLVRPFYYCYFSSKTNLYFENPVARRF